MLHDENDDEDDAEEETLDSIVTSWRTSCCAVVMQHVTMMHRDVVSAVAVDVDTYQEKSRALEARDTRRSRTRARSESETSPKTHRPAIESSSSSTPFASAMMVHIDGDLVSM